MASIYNSVVEFYEAKTVLSGIIHVLSVIAVVELVLFAGVFYFSLMSTVLRPDKTTSYFRVVQTSIVYFVFRCIPVPFLIAGLDISAANFDTYMPYITKGCIVILGIWLNLTISVPTLTMWYSRIIYGIGNTPLIPSREPYDFIVMLPVYNETIELLTEGIQSIIDQKYQRERITLHISFDSSDRSKLYLDLLAWLDVHASDNPLCGGTDFVNPPEHNAETVFGVYQGIRVFLHKFPHGGKRHAQSLTFLHIEKQVQMHRLDRTILVLLDSDNYTYDYAFHNIASTFDRHPEKRAFAGYMTCMSSGDNSYNFWNLVQDVEYLSGEMARSFELMLGTVNCLPGGFTSVRLDVMEYTTGDGTKTVAQRYFGDLPVDSLTDYHRNYLGEDRYLSHLLHVTLPRYSMGFCPAARAKTDPPKDFMSVVRQRRRWFFGAISNEVYMLTDSNVWTKFTFMNTFKTIQIAFRTNFFSQVVMSVFAVASVHNEPNSLIPLIISAGVPLVLNYIAAIATAIKLGHSKVFFMQPIMLITMTVVQVFIDFYALFTIRQRSWGGPRHMVAEPAEVTATVEVDVNASPAAPSEASSSASSTKSGPITFKASPSTAQASSRAVASDEQV